MCREIALLDVRQSAAEGAALDIQEMAPLYGFDTRLYGGSDYALIEDSELIVVTAGLPRKPGMSRSDLLASNVAITNTILEGVTRHAPNSMLLFVSNPVDVLTYHAFVETGWPRNRIFGQAGVLDSSRMASFIAMETGYATQDISTMVLGGHGDTMVAMLRYTTISGIPISNFMSKEKLDSIVERTRNGGAEILALRGTSSAYDAPAASVAKMVDAIVHDRKRILPTVSVLEGEYGHHNLAIGVPAVLGINGMEQIISLDMNDEETTLFHNSAALVQKDIDLLKSV
jgi:malate dehydrogenase